MSWAVRRLPRMLFFLLSPLFHLQGICGVSQYEGEFQFCAHRSQSQKSHVHYKTQKDGITIINSEDGLNISAPFPPESGTWNLPDKLGPYIFCVYWFQNTSLFRLYYGNKTKYNLSTQANYSLYHPNVSLESNRTSGPKLFMVSYAYNNGNHNHSLPNASAYTFIFKDSGKGDQSRPVQKSDVEQLHKNLEAFLKNPREGRKKKDGFLHQKLQEFESDLGVMQFGGETVSFGEGTVLHAKVLKIPLEEKLYTITSKQEKDKEVHGFQVILPQNVFVKSKAERRVVLLDITSQLPFQDKKPNQILGEKVIGVSVGNRTIHGLPRDKRVVLTLWHKPFVKNVIPQCVFWDTGSNASHWNTSGCEAERGENQTTCRCNHLTFFAVLMMASPDIESVHHKYLTIVTYVGCIISAAASLITICLFFCSRRKQRDYVMLIYINLLLAIFLLDMSFLIAVPLAPTGSDVGCKAGAMFLHFSMLACLTWMGIEGYSLYRLVIQVFDSYIKHFLFKLCLVGWGLPILLVSLIFAINKSHYGRFFFKVYESSETYTNATICWITDRHINNYLNLGFLSLVLLFNSIMLAAMVREILKLRHREHQWQYAVMLLGLSCVLGIPWGLVFFSFTTGTFKMVAVYLSTIINSLQGFLIFLWYLAKVVLSRKSSSMQCTSSNSVRLQSSNTSL